MQTKKNLYFSRVPARSYRNRSRDAFPSGNGLTGIAVYGGAANEKIGFCRGDLWANIKDAEYPDVTDAFEKMRAVAESGDFQKANRMLCDALNERGYDARVGESLPAGELHIETFTSDFATEYLRYVDFTTGEVGVEFSESGRKHVRRAFVSRKRDLAVMEIACSAPMDYTLDLGLFQWEGGKEIPYPKHGIPEEFLSALKTERAADGFGYSSVAGGKYFGAVMKAQTDGKQSVTERGLLIEGATRIVLLIKVFSAADRPMKVAELDCPLGYEALLAEHVPLHAKLYDRTKLSIYHGKPHSNEELTYRAERGEFPVELCERLWNFGRYIFVSGTCPEGEPFPLYGLWAGAYYLPWPQHVLNINFEMIYWSSFKGNLAELRESALRYFERNVPDYREGAKKLFGCRGIYVHGYTTTGQAKVCVNVPVITNWLGAGAWICAMFFDHYRYGGGKAFLASRAMPFMYEACLFYLDILRLGSDGRYHVYPSVSPENSPLNYMTKDADMLSHPMPTARDATMDIALIRELFTNMLEAISVTGEYEEIRGDLEEKLAKLPDYALDENGELREWIDRRFDQNDDHRHYSHLYPFFPGREIGTNHPLIDAVRLAIENRKGALRYQCDWSFVLLASMYAKLGNGAEVQREMQTLIQSCLTEALFTCGEYKGMGGAIYDPPQAPVQTDGNLGYVAAALDALFQADEEKISLLPALPPAWKKGSLTGASYPGGGTLSVKWDAEKGVLRAVIRGKSASSVAVTVPSAFTSVVIERKP